MRDYIIAGNWKMNGSRASIKILLEQIKAGAANINSNVKLMVFPPYPFLSQAENTLRDTNVFWGAQNVSEQDAGAYTGEISVDMLKDFGCHYVLVGHSERRTLYGETSEIVARKFAKILDANLTPILCIGETLEQREAGFTMKVVEEQLKAVLDLPDGINKISKAIIAYEPVWAIGTGVTATPEQAQEVHASIRAYIAKYNSDAAGKLKILYGGSVKPDNAKSLFTMPDIDGGLIGGASLKAEDFLRIGVSCSN